MTPEESKQLPLVKVSAAALKAKKAERNGKPNKSDFVRAHPNLSGAELVALAAKQGLRLSRSLVYGVRESAPAALKRGPGRPRKTPPPQLTPKRGRGRPRKHPAAPVPLKHTAGSLTAAEKQLVASIFEVGPTRAEQILGGLKTALGL